MSTDPDTWTIRITTRVVTRETYAGETIGYDETGEVTADAGRAYVRRGDAVRVDGCAAETADGVPCANDASDGDYCGMHSDAG